MAEPSQPPADAPSTQDQQQPEQPRPGPRASRLQEIYAESLNRTLAKVGWNNFAGCFPTIAKRAEPVLRQVQEQMVSRLNDKCTVRFPQLTAFSFFFFFFFFFSK
jgi:kinetochore protein NNF1